VVTFKRNPDFNKELMRAAQQKVDKAVAPAKARLLTDRDVLQGLQRGEQFGSEILEHLSRKGLIEVQDASHMGTPAGQRDLLFTFFTDEGRKMLES